MSIIVLADVFLPNAVVSAGVRGKNMRMNSRTDQGNGYQTINVIWSRTLRQFELGTVPMLPSAWAAIEALHEITDGGAYGFLMEDPKDCFVAEGVLSDVSAGLYQLQKRYIDARSSRYADRIITRPRTSNFQLFASGIAVAHTLDEETGLVTIPSEPAAATLSWSGGFYLPVHFQEDWIDWELIAPGAASQRLVSGPSVVLQEIRE
jgi:uncharacterized protein (TIGR02217 family)